MKRPGAERDVFFSSPNVIPLFWEHEHLRPERPLAGAHSQMAEITILHTNDLHSSVDGRLGSDGKIHGGLGRIATTIQHARATGPTLVCAVGDFVLVEGHGGIYREQELSLICVGKPDVIWRPSGIMIWNMG